MNGTMHLASGASSADTTICTMAPAAPDWLIGRQM
jgi:hypothetical protein